MVTHRNYEIESIRHIMSILLSAEIEQSSSKEEKREILEVYRSFLNWDVILSFKLLQFCKKKKDVRFDLAKFLKLNGSCDKYVFSVLLVYQLWHYKQSLFGIILKYYVCK